MMAPVPYSISTKLATQIGISSPLKGLVAYRPVKKPSFSIVARSSAFSDVLRILASLAPASTRARKVRHGELHLGTLRLPDPVPLHQDDAFGPSALELLQVVQQLFRVRGRLQEPLFDLA